MIAFGPDVAASFEEASRREWLEANGRGGYALGTVAQANTRRYHGLLTAAISAPVGRVQLVNRLEEALHSPQASSSLSCQAYPDSVEAEGLSRLQEFRIDPFPVWIFSVGGCRLKKSFFLRYGEDTAVVLYEHLSGPAAELSVRPLLSRRDHHHLQRKSAWAAGAARHDAAGFELPGVPSLRAAALGGTFRPDPLWYRSQFYAEDARRGQDALEDVFAPGSFRFALGPGTRTALVFSTEVRSPADAFDWAERERRQRRDVLERSPLKGPLGQALTAAGDQFIVARGEGVSVVAGYPWFEDWGRDAMISLPGLCLATGRLDDAEKALDVWTTAVKGGRAPNRFEESGAPVFNTVDAGLWLVAAAQRYLAAAKELDALRRWRPVMHGIVDAIEKGDRKGVHMDKDGLVWLPPEEGPLTWMDARTDGVAVTPRWGKPVEIQALWYNALEFLAELDLKLKEPSRGYEKLAAIARASFNEKFWNEREPYLYDRLEGREKDAAVRPNALLAVSLPYEILDVSRFRAVVDRAERDLLAPEGLRTLAPGDPAYKGRYGGGPVQRDGAYHQGTVWPWLLGPFCTAYIKAHGSSEETKARVAGFLRPLREYALSLGAGQLPEVFDGDEPRGAGGCPAQAWSVAEVLRVLWEESIPL